MDEFSAKVIVAGGQESWEMTGDSLTLFKAIEKKAKTDLPGFTDILAKVIFPGVTVIALMGCSDKPLAMGRIESVSIH